MFSSIKKYLFISILVIILGLGGVWFYRRSKNTVISNQNSSTEEEKNWGNISGWFLDDPDLKKLWKNHNFTYNQTHDWINIGLSPTDAVFAFWLQNKKKLTPEEVLNHGNEQTLREEWINEEGNEENAAKFKTDIINCLNIWLTDYTTWSNDKETLEAVKKTIKDLRSSTLNDGQKLNSLKNLLENHYQVGEDISDSDYSDDEDRIRLFDTTPASSKNKTSQNYQQLLELAQQWKISEEESESEEENWFGKSHKLTSEEIDWAVEKIKKNNKFKILPASQFHLVSIAIELTEKTVTADNVLFSQLLNDIQDKEVELVFIPVNNNENHWSLLIYEKSSGLFYHYDINEGVNFEYAAPLLIDLLTKMKPTLAKDNIDSQWWESSVKNRLGKEKENDYNSGIAVINIMQRIIQLYNSRFRIVDEVVEQNGEKYTKSRHNFELVEKDLGEFNFSEERKIWQERHLSENKN